ncbi:unnamed protein product [Rhizoctonia solani]|uniref:Uncharacterized protein n=1 Tax=Rhizoctonia solani TaxID=456999 RepID=A0A8H3H2L6_9AGAM|nr:unnamed protein product [Rhizoctonia solani]
MSIDPNPKPLQGPWEGDTKIVIGIDIGTTQSGVAFAFLQNGQEAHNQQSKIPTLVWYDTDKKAVSFGAEAQLYTTEEQAEDNGWFLAKYFKLHLHPSDMQTKHELKLDPLPPGVSLRQIYSDFLGYLLNHTRTYFEDRILDGKSIWERHSPAMEVIIAHPNGWGLREQHFLRQATTEAGFSTSDQASRKIRFVTEAEASVHFCIHHTSLGNVLRPGMSFAVCDAGGSTVDSTLYLVTAVRPILKLVEKRASACVQAGAIFVDFEVEKFLRKTLANIGLSPDDIADYTKAGVKDFESFAKRAFKDETAEQSVAVAHTRFNNASIRARRGRMTMSGSTIKDFFDHDDFLLVAQYILLVGGFGDSLYIRSAFRKRYEPRGSQVTLTNDSTSKAVADGAVIWSTLSSVYSRAPRYSFGAAIAIPFIPGIHQMRVPYTSARGYQMVFGAWSQIVQKGVALDAEAVCRKPYAQLYKSANPDLELFTVDLLAYPGDDVPEWAHDPSKKLCPGFQDACTIRANLKNLEGALVSGQEAASMESMVPTMVWYDTDNKAVAFGAESLLYHVEEQAKNQGWFLAKHFKAHLYPEDIGAQHNPRISALPFGVTLRQVYSDFLGYLLKHTKIYFEERMIDGAQIWERYQPTMELVISHPYGWKAREQSFLRDMAVSAGYTTFDLAPRNICLTSEPQAGNAFILCDAGSTTTSISLHKVESTNPILKLETRNLERLEGGSASIDTVAETYMRQKMTNAGLSAEDLNDFTRVGIEDFRKHVKFAFSDETKEHLIQIANLRFNNPALSIRRGRMALPGPVIKSFFVGYVDAIKQAIDRCAAGSTTNISIQGGRKWRINMGHKPE